MTNTETITEVLAAHQSSGKTDMGVVCDCGDDHGTNAKDVQEQHRTHVAAMVAAALEPVIRERERVSNWDAWSDGHEAGFEEAKNPGAFVNDYWDSDLPNPYDGPTP